jgi:hypothetical protein
VRARIIDYSLNKFCPLLIIGFLLFYNFGYAKFEPYVIMGLIFFIERFNFKVGYAVAYCESMGINLEDE